MHAAAQQPLEVELVMPRQKWFGTLVGRDGDLLKFQRRNSPSAILLGTDTIQEIKFDIKFDEAKIRDLLNAREFDKVIKILSSELAPFRIYSDVPSNLTPYNFKLMQVYFWNGNFTESLELAAKIMTDSTNPSFQNEALVFRVLGLIELGKESEAEKLMDSLEGGSITVSPPARLYTKSKILALRGSYGLALETAAKVVAFYSQDADWMPPAELLCAEMYAELGYFDSAQQVIYQISILYKNTPEYDKAQQLKLKVDRMRAEKKLEEIESESEEA